MKYFLSALVVVIGTAAFLFWRDHGGRMPSLPPLPFVTSRVEAAKPTPPLVNSKATSKSRRVVTASAANAPDPTPEPPPPSLVEESAPPKITASRPIVAPPHLPFPAADKIAVGVDTDSVTGEYGDPSAWAVAAEDGHVVETLVYLRERVGPATVIRIVDGRVAAAYTKISPVSPQGSLIRNFGLQN